MTLESSIEQTACRLILQQLGVTSVKLNVQGTTGYPDRIFWVPGGKPLLIEFKRPGGKVEPKQLHIHAQLRKLGYHVEVIDNAANALQAVVSKCSVHLGKTRLRELHAIRTTTKKQR